LTEAVWRRHLEKVVETITEGVVVIDARGQIIYANPAAERILGLARDEVTARTYKTATRSFTTEDGEPFPEEDMPFARVLREKRPIYNIEQGLLRPDGTRVFVAVSAAPYFSRRGALLGVVATLTDITALKRARQRAGYELDVSNLLLRAAHILSSSLEIQAVLEALADIIAEATARSRIHIGLLDKETGELEIKVAWGKPAFEVGDRYRVNDISPQFWDAFKAKKPVIVDYRAPDIPAATKKVASECGIRLALIVPLIVRGEVIGGFGIDEPWKAKPFTARDIELTEGIAAHAAIAIENANLHKQTEEELQRTILLQDIATAATTDPNIHKVASNILRTVRRHMKIISGDIKMFDEERHMFRVLSMQGYSERRTRASREIPFTASDLLTIRAVKTRAVQTHREDMLTPGRLRYLKEMGMENARYMVVPIEYRDKIIGTLAMAFGGKRDFTQNEIDLCRSIAYIVGQTIENARLYEAERSIANTLQEAILIMPNRVHGIEFGHLYRSATIEARVGGDFYDIFEIERDKIGILIGDVSGKGVEAAALTSIVKNTIKAHAYENSTPAMIISKANDLLVRTTPPQIFVTVFFGILNTETGSLSYCSAGHPPTIIKRRSGSVDLLAKYSPAIGAFSGLSYRSGRVKLRKGDVFILYTDGVTEARNDGSFFGEERLIACAQGLGLVTAEEVPHLIYEDVIGYCQGNLSDDIAILSITRNHKNDV